MTGLDKANQFMALHDRQRPLVLCNVCDAGSARTVAQAGAKAVATSSWAVAAAQGCSDGEALPFEALQATVRRIAAVADLPLSVDFERGYAEGLRDIAVNATRLIEAGAIGVNFEDGTPGGQSVLDVSDQCQRIGAVRRGIDATGVPGFLNARTDLFLAEPDISRHGRLVEDAIDRARAYADAGADGFFAPGLKDRGLVRQLCEGVDLPVNVMVTDMSARHGDLVGLGVARVSLGPAPYLACMATLSQIADAPADI